MTALGWHGIVCLCVDWQELVSIDCKQAAQMVISTLADSLKEVVKKLKSNQSVLFEFLQGVMSYK